MDGDYYDSGAPTTGSHAWVWIILALVVIAAVVIIIILLVTRSNEQKELEAFNVVFSNTSTNTVQATWSGTSNADDQLELFASTGPLTFTKEGNPESSGNFSALIFSSGKVASSADRATVGPLTAGLSYNVALVVSNPSVKAVRVYTEQTFMAVQPINGSKFQIVDINQPGSIRTTGTAGTVVYSTTPSKTNNDVWTYDNGLICLTSVSASNPTCASANSQILYNNNGVLAVKAKGTVDTSTYLWAYSGQGKNEWCLRSDATKCMSYIPSASQAATPQAINVNGSPTKWVNTTL